MANQKSTKKSKTRSALVRSSSKKALCLKKQVVKGALINKPVKATVGSVLLDLGQEKELVPAVLVRRPSLRNKSPWVADIRLKNGRIALAHVPSLDMGGLCVDGTQLLLKEAVDSKGKPVGANAVGSYGTPKCEFILQLVRIDEPETKQYGSGPCWCGAHPNIGEKLAQALLERSMVKELPSSVVGLRREVAGVAGCDMRADFVLEHSDKSSTVVEVKTVLNTDYNPATAPSRKECVYLGPSSPYQRAGIFPWGRVSQDGPKGEKVVSARAIKHVDELAAIARGLRRDKTTKLQSMMLFIVVRHDVKSMRVNPESCPSFAEHAHEATKAGVRIAAHRVRWGVGKDLGKAFWDGPLKVCIPTSKSRNTQVASNKRPVPTGTSVTQSSKKSKKSK